MLSEKVGDCFSSCTEEHASRRAGFIVPCVPVSGGEHPDRSLVLWLHSLLTMLAHLATAFGNQVLQYLGIQISYSAYIPDVADIQAG